MPLPPKRERFVDEYLVDLNATQAAIRAGYAESGARQEGSRLLSIADVQQRVREKLDAARITPELVLSGVLSNAERASEQGAYGASTASWQLLARILGMLETPVTITDIRERSRVMALAAGLDPDEVEREALALLAPPD